MTSAELKYLIAIDELHNDNAGIKLTDIGSKLNVTKVSVYRAAERLERGGYIRRDEKKKITMTELGYLQLAEYMTIIKWLGAHLEIHCNVPKEIAYKDASGVVCAMSDESRHGLAEFIKSLSLKQDRKGQGINI